MGKPAKKTDSYWLIEIREIQWLHAKATGARRAIKKLLRRSARRAGKVVAHDPAR